MSDQARTPGNYVKRSATPTDTAARTYTSGVAGISLHWVWKCLATGAWRYVRPDDALVEMWILTLIPAVHFGIKVIRFYADRWARARGIDVSAT